MSETYPPEGGESNVPQEPAPREVPPVTPVPQVPPAPPAAPQTPQPGVPTVDPLAAPPTKRHLNWGFAVLGFVTPWLVGVATGFIFNALAGLGDMAMQIAAPAANVLTFGVFIGMIVAFLIGRSQGNERLRSFGLGGLIQYAVVALVGLLAWGACMVTMGG